MIPAFGLTPQAAMSILKMTSSSWRTVSTLTKSKKGTGLLPLLKDKGAIKGELFEKVNNIIETADDLHMEILPHDDGNVADYYKEKVLEQIIGFKERINNTPEIDLALKGDLKIISFWDFLILAEALPVLNITLTDMLNAPQEVTTEDITAVRTFIRHTEQNYAARTEFSATAIEEYDLRREGLRKTLNTIEQELKRETFLSSAFSKYHAKLSKHQELISKSVQAISTRDSPADANTYLACVYANLRLAPEYHPLGKVLHRKRDKWKNNINHEKAEVTARTKGFGSKVKFECKYETDLNFYEPNLKKRRSSSIWKKSAKFEKDGDYGFLCIALNSVDAALAERVRTLKFSNMSLYIYSLDKNELYFNENDLNAKLFAGYFRTGEYKLADSVGLIEQLFQTSANDMGDLSLPKVGRELKLDKCDIKELFRRAEKNGLEMSREGFWFKNRKYCLKEVE